MMHFGMLAPAFPSHWRAMEAIAQALLQRGHRVTFFHQQDASRLLRDPDVGFIALGQDTHPTGSLAACLQRAASPGSPLGLRRVIQDMAATTAMLCRSLPVALERAGVDALVCDQMEAAGGMVAEAMALPFVSVACALPVNREAGLPLPVMPWALPRTQRDVEIVEASTRVYDHLMAPHRQAIATAAKQLGIASRGALHECLSPYAQLSQTIAGFDFPRKESTPPLHHLGPFRKDMPQQFPSLPLAPDRPFVFASLGTLQGQRRGVFERISTACRREGVQLLIAHCGGLSPRQAAGLAVPGQVWVTDFAPQQAVLERADAVFSHAGLNTVLDAFAAGTPVLALPIAFDQPGVAARVVQAGAGLKASARWAGARRLQRDLRRLLGEPGFATNAKRLGTEIAGAGGSSRAAQIIEQVAVDRRPVPAHAA